MSYLLGYGADAGASVGFLDKIKAWWGTQTTAEKVAYVAGGVVAAAAIAMVVGGKKKGYTANGRKTRKSRKARRNGKEASAAQRLLKYHRDIDHHINDAIGVARHAHGARMASDRAIQEALNELALAKGANLRGDMLTAKRLLASALAHLGVPTQVTSTPRIAKRRAMKANGKWDGEIAAMAEREAAQKTLEARVAEIRRGRRDEGNITPEMRAEAVAVVQELAAERHEASVEAGEAFEGMLKSAVKTATTPAAKRELDLAATLAGAGLPVVTRAEAEEGKHGVQKVRGGAGFRDVQKMRARGGGGGRPVFMESMKQAATAAAQEYDPSAVGFKSAKHAEKLGYEEGRAAALSLPVGVAAPRTELSSVERRQRPFDWGRNRGFNDVLWQRGEYADERRLGGMTEVEYRVMPGQEFPTIGQAFPYNWETYDDPGAGTSDAARRARTMVDRYSHMPTESQLLDPRDVLRLKYSKNRRRTRKTRRAA